MEIEFDPAEDAKNIRERGIPLALGADVLANPVVEFVDDRRDYGERRMVAVGEIDGRLHVCVYTVRGAARRIVSLREANPKEVRKRRGSS